MGVVPDWKKTTRYQVAIGPEHQLLIVSCVNFAFLRLCVYVSVCLSVKVVRYPVLFDYQMLTEFCVLQSIYSGVRVFLFHPSVLVVTKCVRVCVSFT